MEVIAWQYIWFVITLWSELVAIDKSCRHVWSIAKVSWWHPNVCWRISVAMVVLKKQVRRVILGKHRAVHHYLVALFDVGDAWPWSLLWRLFDIRYVLVYILCQVGSLLLFELKLILNTLNITDMLLVYLLWCQSFVIRITTSTRMHVQRAHSCLYGVLCQGNHVLVFSLQLLQTFYRHIWIDDFRINLFLDFLLAIDFVVSVDVTYCHRRLALIWHHARMVLGIHAEVMQVLGLRKW